MMYDLLPMSMDGFEPTALTPWCYFSLARLLPSLSLLRKQNCPV